MEKTNFIEFFKWLIDKWMELPNRQDLTFPYLTMPSEAFCANKLRVVVVCRETNGWGDKEKFPIDAHLMDNLSDLYDTKVNRNWENLGAVWPMYKALRSLSEVMKGGLSNPPFSNMVGFLQANVALIGQHYDEKGYNPEIKDLLIEACDKFFNLCNPGIILLPIGFGTITQTQKPYVDILENTKYFGKLKGIKQLNSCSQLFKLEFENITCSEVYGCPYPLGLAYDPIVNEMAKIIQKKLSENGISTKTT